MPWEKREQLMEEMGQTYPLFVIDRQNLLPPYGEERRLADIIMMAAQDDPLVAITTYKDLLVKEFPLSSYIAMCRSKIDSVEKIAKVNSSNEGIHIRNEQIEIKSLADIVAPYRGKVVYLDVWGTWCGPCIREMRYAGELRERFSNQDIIFLYLDKDEERNDDRWREFVYIHKLEGEHIRVNERQMEIIWKELGEQSQAYPKYYIFDKTGALVVKNADRPSDGQSLYQQISHFLN
jgi:thiol-disulfide isomerase/thioredoxin